MPTACIANRDRTDGPANPESALPFDQFIVSSMAPPGRFRQSMRTAFGIGQPDRADGGEHFKNVKLQDSKKNNLILLADIV